MKPERVWSELRALEISVRDVQQRVHRARRRALESQRDKAFDSRSRVDDSCPRVRTLGRAATAFLSAVTLAGCGLVFQGTSQTLQLTSIPSQAAVGFQGQSASTPATVTVSRRNRGFAVYRGERPDFHPACVVVPCGTPKWLKVVDSIPAAIPLLVDLAAGALANCNVPPLVLPPKGPDAVDFTLPPDDRIIQAFNNQRVDLCEHPYLYDEAFAERAARIIVTAGNLQRTSEELGPVDFGRIGGDWVRWVTFPIGNSTYTHVTRTFSKATPEEINELMRRRALFLYGTKVDAVINVAYQDNPRHDVFATGLAVRFTDASSNAPRGVEPRLEELKRLFDKGVISEPEYRKRREEILRSL